MAIFNLAKPQYTLGQWSKSIAIRIIIPPILLWDLLKLAGNYFLGTFIGGIILPAQKRNFSMYQIQDVAQLNTEILHHEQHSVVTYDGASLDTLEITPASQQPVEAKYKKYIINFVGNVMGYEDIVANMQADAEELDSNVIGFNFRGVSRSSSRARSQKDLLTDAIAQVQRLLDAGISPQNITLKGYSIGAGIASLAAHHFHQQGHPINLFNDRSFSSLTNVVVGQIRKEGNPSHIETFRGKLLGWLAKPFIKLALLLANWEINADDAFRAVPEEYREYIVVRTRKEVRVATDNEDPVIPHYASIHAALQPERRAKKAEIDHLVAEMQRVKSQADPLAKPSLDAVNLSLLEARASFKRRKMENNAFEPNGHVVRASDLGNRYNTSAVTFFREFVQRAYVDHAIRANPPLIM